MPVVYGGGKGRIHRAQQVPYDPENPKSTRYGRNRREGKDSAEKAPITAVVVVDLHSGESTVYPSIADAAKALYCSVAIVSARMNGRVKKPIDGRWACAKWSGQ